MTTIIIEDNSPQAKKLLEYIETLPYATVIDEKKKGFHEAAEECNAVSIGEFIDELKSQVKAHFDNA